MDHAKRLMKALVDYLYQGHRAHTAWLMVFLIGLDIRRTEPETFLVGDAVLLLAAFPWVISAIKGGRDGVIGDAVVAVAYGGYLLYVREFDKVVIAALYALLPWISWLMLGKPPPAPKEERPASPPESGPCSLEQGFPDPPPSPPQSPD